MQDLEQTLEMLESNPKRRVARVKTEEVLGQRKSIDSIYELYSPI